VAVLTAGLEPIAFLLLLNQAFGEFDPLLEVQNAIFQLMDDRLQIAFEAVVVLGVPSREPVGQGLPERTLDNDECSEEQPEHEDKVTGNLERREP